MEVEFSFRRYLEDRNSRYGDEVSPGIEIQEVPDKAESVALIMEDLDSTGPGNFTNWVIWNIPPSRDLEEELPDKERLSFGALHGSNDYGEIGYGGPEPGRGSRHTYRFRIYALDQELNLQPGASRPELEEAIEGHVVDKTEKETLYWRDFDEPKFKPIYFGI